MLEAPGELVHLYWANFTNTSNAFSTGLVNGYQGVGGLVEHQNQPAFYRAIPMPKLQRQGSFAGGLSGANHLIENSYATGAAHTRSPNGQVVCIGNNKYNSVINSCHRSRPGMDAVGNARVIHQAIVENSYATGQVTRTSGNAMTFGKEGRYGGTINNSYWNRRRQQDKHKLLVIIQAI